MDGWALGCVEGTSDGCSDVLVATHSFNDSASAIASKDWHSLLSSPFSQQFTVLDLPSGSITVKLVTRGDLLGANEGSLLSDGWLEGWLDGWLEDWLDGCDEGSSLGSKEGEGEGSTLVEGCWLGLSLGTKEGTSLGAFGCQYVYEWEKSESYDFLTSIEYTFT